MLLINSPRHSYRNWIVGGDLRDLWLCSGELHVQCWCIVAHTEHSSREEDAGGSWSLAGLAKDLQVRYSSTSQSDMMDNFTIHIAFYAVWRSQHTHLQSHYMHYLLLPHINILCGQGSHIAQWCFGPTLLCSFFSSIRSRLLQEVEGLETEEIERVSYLVPCMHVLIIYIPCIYLMSMLFSRVKGDQVRRETMQQNNPRYLQPYSEQALFTCFTFWLWLIE